MKKIFFLFTFIISLIYFLDEKKLSSIELISHRGANDQAPEHTLSAYEKAVELGADYIELDLRMTKDGHLISLHDETVERTTNGEGEISDFTLKDLKKLDAGSWFDEEFKGESIPLLEEVIDRFGRNTKYYIETRPQSEQLVMEVELVQILKAKGVLDRTIIQSSSVESLKKIHKLNKDIPLIQLVMDKNLDQVDPDAVKAYAIGVGPYAPYVNKFFVDRMQAAGLEVHVWFVNSNEKELMPKILSYNVDYVFTDYLTDTKKIIKEVEELDIRKDR